MTYQSFLNAILESQGNRNLSVSVRCRLVRIVLSKLKFNGTAPDISEIEAEYGIALTKSMREFVEHTIGSIQGAFAVDATIAKDIWNFSEIAHDIEEQRVEDRARHRRVHRIVDGPVELPGYAEASAD